jgi:hypothetical protein
LYVNVIVAEVVVDKVHVPLVKLQLLNGLVDVEFDGVDDVPPFKS